MTDSLMLKPDVDPAICKNGDGGHTERPHPQKPDLINIW